MGGQTEAIFLFPEKPSAFANQRRYLLQIITIAMPSPTGVQAASSTMTCVLKVSAFLTSLVDAALPYAKAAMKHFSTLVTFLLGALSVSSPAVAQHEASRGRDFARGPGQGEMQRPFMRRNDQRRIDGDGEQPVLREASTIQPAEELKAIPMQGTVLGPGRERLSPEERRQLRRDINAAGRDIYRRNRPD